MAPPAGPRDNTTRKASRTRIHQCCPDCGGMVTAGVETKEGGIEMGFECGLKLSVPKGHAIKLTKAD